MSLALLANLWRRRCQIAWGTKRCGGKLVERYISWADTWNAVGENPWTQWADVDEPRGRDHRGARWSCQPEQRLSSWGSRPTMGYYFLRNLLSKRLGVIPSRSHLKCRPPAWRPHTPQSLPQLATTHELHCKATRASDHTSAPPTSLRSPRGSSSMTAESRSV